MITQGFDFIAAIAGLCAFFVWIEHRYPHAFFKWFPSIVLVMFASMAMYTLGVWEMSAEVRTARRSVRDNLIPAMLFLMSLRFNLAVMRSIGFRLIALCILSTLSIMLAFVVVHQIMAAHLGEETPLTFATMSAGWTGGTQNFVAVKEALSVTDAAMSYTLLMGALCYSVWLILIIAIKPLKSRFDSFLRADDAKLAATLAGIGDVELREPATMPALMLMFGLSLVVAALCLYVGALFSNSGVFNPMIWAILCASLLGMAAAPTWLGKSAGSDEISGMMLYLLVALIGAEVNLAALSQAPLYILSGFLILGVHAALILLAARALRMNLHLAGLASIANIGSAPSAAIVGAAYHRNLIPVAIIMALIGSMLGSFVGLAVAEILIWLEA